MVKRNRRIFIILCIVFSFMACSALALPTFAGECSGTNTSILNCDAGGDGGVFYIIKLVTDIMTAGIGILAVVGVIICGFMILTARDNEAQVSKAKKRILEIVIGIILWSLLWVVVNLFLPNGALGNDANGITGVTISVPDSLDVGDFAHPDVTISPDTVKDKTYSLKSSDTTIVSIVRGGSSIECMKPGTAEITVTTANGKNATAAVKCKEKPKEEASGGGNSGGGNSGGGNSYSPSQRDTMVAEFRNLPTQSWEELKQLAKTKYGISEGNFIGIVAWARIEAYELHRGGNDPNDIYQAYLCTSVSTNKAISYEKAGDSSGWLNEILGYPDPDYKYRYAREYGTTGYYQSTLKIVNMALNHLYPNVMNCNGTEGRPANPVNTWTSVDGVKIWVW